MNNDSKERYVFMDPDLIGTPDRIAEWIESAKTKFATHLILVTDTFNYEDYPVEVTRHQNFREVISERNARSMQRVYAVYEIKKGQATRIDYWMKDEMDSLNTELDHARNKIDSLNRKLDHAQDEIRDLKAQLNAKNG